MIRIQIRRAGLIVIAATANDYGDVSSTWGFTEAGATQRLHRLLDRGVVR